MRDVRAVAAAVLSGGLLFSTPGQSQVAGFIPGTFDVDQGGAATYTIPLIVAPGAAGSRPMPKDRSPSSPTTSSGA